MVKNKTAFKEPVEKRLWTIFNTGLSFTGSVSILLRQEMVGSNRGIIRFAGIPPQKDIPEQTILEEPVLTGQVL